MADPALSSAAITQEITDGVALASAIIAKQPFAVIALLIKLGPEVIATMKAIEDTYPAEVHAVESAFAMIGSLFPKGTPVDNQPVLSSDPTGAANAP